MDFQFNSSSAPVNMLLVNWLKLGKISVSSPMVLGLPDPIEIKGSREALLMKTAQLRYPPPKLV